MSVIEFMMSKYVLLLFMTKNILFFCLHNMSNKGLEILAQLTNVEIAKPDVRDPGSNPEPHSCV